MEVKDMLQSLILNHWNYMGEFNLEEWDAYELHKQLNDLIQFDRKSLKLLRDWVKNNG